MIGFAKYVDCTQYFLTVRSHLLFNEWECTRCTPRAPLPNFCSLVEIGVFAKTRSCKRVRFANIKKKNNSKIFSMDIFFSCSHYFI
jgi:hypothetical protein